MVQLYSRCMATHGSTELHCEQHKDLWHMTDTLTDKCHTTRNSSQAAKDGLHLLLAAAS